MRLLNKEDLNHIAHGAAFLGAGGGGTLSSTLKMIDEWYPDGKELKLLSVDEAAADDSSFTVVTSFIGSQAANEGLTNLKPAIRAAEAMNALLKKEHGKPMGRTIAVEMGVQSSAVPNLLVALNLGLDSVDADGAGRAVPVLPATLYAGAKLSASPTLLTNDAECVLNVDDPSPAVANQIASGVVGTDPFHGVAGMTLWAMDGATLKSTIAAEGSTRGTIELALKLGQIFDSPGDAPVDQVLKVLREAGLTADIAFQGQFLGSQTTLDKDYQIVYFGDTNGRRIVNYTAGESLVLWDADNRDQLVIAPDSICYMTPEGQTFSNTELPPPGTEVVIVAIETRKAVAASQEIQNAFQFFLRLVGYPGPYVPFTELAAQGAKRKNQ